MSEIKIRDKIKYINVKDLQKYTNNNKKHPEYSLEFNKFMKDNNFLKWKICEKNTNYVITSCGNIIRFCREQYTKKGDLIRLYNSIILKGSIDRYGYKTIRLIVNGKKRHIKIHRLVAEAFIPNCNDKPQINHINGVKTDNRIENLEWNTGSENIKHAIRNKLLVQKKGNYSPFTKISSYDYISIYYMYKYIKVTQKEISLLYNVSRQCIGSIIKKVDKIIIIN